MPQYFSAEKIYHNGRFGYDNALAVDDEGSIIGLLPYRHARKEAGSNLIDFGNRILAPGWVDLQLNGCGGGLFNRDLNLDCLEKMLRGSLRHGTTSIQPTLISCSDEDILNALEIIREAQQKARRASAVRQRQLYQGIMGMHLEGPYISVARRGAHPEHQVRALDESMLQKLEAAGRDGVLTYITVGAESVQPLQVARLSASGLTVSLGHTGAAIQDSRALLLAGARCFTHLYNGMGGIDSRDPHTLSLALEDPRAYSGIIADGHHVAKENIRIAQRLLGERLFLVTDATAMTDVGERQIFFGEQTCQIQNGTIRNEEGALAGSALTMKRGVEILSDLFGLKVALDMATLNPVCALNPQRHYNQRIGTFAPGSRANFVVLDFSCSKKCREDNYSEITALQTWVLGQRWED